MILQCIQYANAQKAAREAYAHQAGRLNKQKYKTNYMNTWEGENTGGEK